MTGTCPPEVRPAPRTPAAEARGRAAAFALAAVVFWATGPTLALVAVAIPPFFVLSVAALAGFAASGVFAALRGEGRAFLALPISTRSIVAIGLLGNNSLFLFAMPRIGAAEASVIIFLWPILLVMILSYRGGVRLSVPQKLGIAIGFTGAVLAIGPTFGHGFDPLGLALAFGGGLFFAIYSAIRTHGREAHGVVGPSMGVMAVLAYGLHLATEAPVTPSPRQWAALVLLGVLALTVSNSFWDRATRTGHVAIVSPIAYLTPLVSLLFLAILGVETVTFAAAAGGVLVVAGALIASGIRA